MTVDRAPRSPDNQMRCGRLPKLHCRHRNPVDDLNRLSGRILLGSYTPSIILSPDTRSSVDLDKAGRFTARNDLIAAVDPRSVVAMT